MVRISRLIAGCVYDRLQLRKRLLQRPPLPLRLLDLHHSGSLASLGGLTPSLSLHDRPGNCESCVKQVVQQISWKCAQVLAKFRPEWEKKWREPVLALIRRSHACGNFSLSTSPRLQGLCKPLLCRQEVPHRAAQGHVGDLCCSLQRATRSSETYTQNPEIILKSVRWRTGSCASPGPAESSSNPLAGWLYKLMYVCNECMMHVLSARSKSTYADAQGLYLPHKKVGGREGQVQQQ